MLDIECFTYLNKALESPFSPYVILATNRGLCTIRGTEADSDSGGIQAPHGIPTDLLDRCLIVRTAAYSQDEIKAVLAQRLKVEGLNIAPAALERLALHGDSASLRYALQLLTPASVLARLAGRDEIEEQDVGEMAELFIDAKTSATLLRSGLTQPMTVA